MKKSLLIAAGIILFLTNSLFGQDVWETIDEIIQLESSTVSFTEIQVDKDGNLYLMVKDVTNTNPSLRLFKRVSNTWTEIGNGISTGFPIQYPALALDPLNGEAYIAYDDGSIQNKAVVRKWNSTNWDLVGPAGISIYGARNIQLKFSASGILHLAFKDGGPFKVMTFKNGIWESLGNGSFRDDYQKLIFSGDIPYVFHFDLTDEIFYRGGLLYVKKFNEVEGAWEQVGNTLQVDEVQDFDNTINYQLNSSGEPIISYIDVNRDEEKIQFYKQPDDNPWESITSFNETDNDVKVNTSGILQYVDSDNFLYIAFKNLLDDNKYNLFRLSGTTWESVGNRSFTLSNPSIASISGAEDGRLYFSYYTGGFLRVHTILSEGADAEAPVINCPIVDFNANADNLCFTTVGITEPTATDNSNGVITFEGLRTDGRQLSDPFPVGMTVISWTATDEVGNVSESCDQIVQVTGTGDCWIQTGPDISDDAPTTGFGSAADMNANGSRVVIGALDFNTLTGGRAMVFEWNNNDWVPLGNTMTGEAVNDQFGEAVAINHLGNRVVIGATGNDDNGISAGHVRVFELINNTWEQLGSDLDGDSANDGYGSAVSINASGDIIAIGSPRNNANGIQSGQVKVFQLQQGNWVQLGTDLEGLEENDLFGGYLELNDSGTRLVVSVYSNDGGGLNRGMVQVFEFSNSIWNLMGSPLLGEADYDTFGRDVSINAEGNRVAVSASEDAGHVRIFEWNNSEWIQLGTDLDGAQSGDMFGASIDLNGDGNRISVGAFTDTNGPSSGQIRVFELQSGSWTQLGQSMDGIPSSLFGNNTALSEDGSKVLGGTSVIGNGYGSARVYAFSGNTYDDEAPMILCPPTIVEFAPEGEFTIPVGITELPIVTDNLSSQESITITGERSDGGPLPVDDNLELFPISNVIITWTATDEAGNTSSCEQLVSIAYEGNSVSLDAGALTLSDGTADADDNYTLSVSDEGNLIIASTSGIQISGIGVEQVNAYTVHIPLSQITNGLTLDGGGGANTLTLDTSLSLLGINNGLTLNNLNVQLIGSADLLLNALEVNNGEYDTNGLTTEITTEANFNEGAILSGTGTINGVVNMNEGSSSEPGASPGIISTGNLIFNPGSTFLAEVNGPNPGTDYDQIVVIGSVNIVHSNTEENPKLIYLEGYHIIDCSEDEIILLNNDGDDPVVGTFSNLPEGAIIASEDMLVLISYIGGDGNDISLTIKKKRTLNIEAIVAPDEPLQLGQEILLSATFSGDDISSATWHLSSDGVDYDYSSIGQIDGNSILFDNNTGEIPAGIYTLKLEITDVCGNLSTLNANGYLVIFDPDGGHVTGGGFIDSPAQALVGSNQQGTANFGFSAKYKKGNNQVDGNTNFQFKAGDFHFKSSYNNDMSLVISGNKKATYKGVGAINGTGEYKFMVSVIDGDAQGGDGDDKFRIKIWEVNSDDEKIVIYDNEVDKSDNADALTPITKGSIVIHNEKVNSNALKVNLPLDLVIQDGEKDDFQVLQWPNPTTDSFTISVETNNLENAKIQVFDFNGKLIINNEFNPYEGYRFGDDLEAGLYIVKIIQAKKETTLKLVKK